MRIFQPIITGSFTVSGSVFFPTLVTSSTAVTNVVMFGTNGELFTTASTAIGGGGTIDTGSLVTTTSFNAYTGSNTSQFAGTASHAITAENVTGTVNTALTASYATNFTIVTSLTVDGAQVRGSNVASTIVGSNNLFQQATGSYTSAHGKYTLHNGTNARAGEFITVWNGNSVEYYDNSTNDIGNTEDITFQSLIVTGQIQINAVAASSGWTVKMLITYI
jgi:hypothetical protein